MMIDQCLHGAGQATAIVTCINTFSTTMSLPCAHRIQKCLYYQAGGRVLKLEDIHPHWQYVKPPRQANGQAEKQEEITHGGNDNEAMDAVHTPSLSPADDILCIQEPAIVESKGRPPGALNRA